VEAGRRGLLRVEGNVDVVGDGRGGVDNDSNARLEENDAAAPRTAAGFLVPAPATEPPGKCFEAMASFSSSLKTARRRDMYERKEL